MKTGFSTRPRATLAFIASAALTALPASPAEAQTFVPDPVTDMSWLFQMEKPFLSGADGLAFYSTILEVDALFPLRSGQTLQLGLPMSIAGADGIDGTSLFLGNLRAALLFGEPGAPSGWLGLTLPTASNVGGPELAVLVMALPRLDEPEMWGDDAVSLRGAWVPARPLDNGGQIGLRLGGAAVLPTDFEDLFVFARAAGWASLPVGDGSLRGDLGTSYSLNDDDGLGDQFTAYLTIEGRFDGRAGRPAVFLRIPLGGDARDVLDLSLGIRLTY